MRIMCLNGWGGRLHDALAAYMRSVSPDVLCLQEVVHTPASDMDWLDYRDGDHVLPQRANFFRGVALALPDHVATFCPAARGELWDGDRAVPSQWGLATFVRAGIPVIGDERINDPLMQDSSFTFGEIPKVNRTIVPSRVDPSREDSVLVRMVDGEKPGDRAAIRRANRMQQATASVDRIDSLRRWWLAHEVLEHRLLVV